MKGPPAPHEWETHEAIDELYRLLGSVGCQLMINTSASASSAVNMEISKSAAPTSQTTTQKPAAANKKKKGFSYLAPSSNQSQQQSATESDEWKRKLESNKASSMTTAEAFTKQFVQNELTTRSDHSFIFFLFPFL